ncbi:MAG: S-layer homology domain-containing protein, partial [Syntrophomonadaceae bacterium]|nr:S-layer homology domain-containing protein [Syntrophomonadaceae bacterium]
MKRRSYITTICICFCIFFTMTAQPAIAFPDTREHWAQSHIDLLQSRELIAGYPDGSYRPEDPVTRQELVSLLIRILGEGEDAVQLQQGETAYKDTADAWARGYIELARELSIVHGDEQGYFNPDVAVTREEAVIMMVNSLDLEAITEAAAEFIDDEIISEWARP